MSLLQVENACFSYGGAPLFDNVTLTVEPGEVCCLMGPNGCGKSTLIDCILGERPLQSGSIRIGGRLLEEFGQKELAQKISYVPQSHTRSFPYTVEQVVLMGRTPHQSRGFGPGREDLHLVQNALCQVGISHLQKQPYTQISGGELQLVLLARALVQAASVIILDEPTAHLDFRNELLFLETLATLVQEEKIGVLMATHSPNQGFYFENRGVPVRVAAMERGGMDQVGAPESVLTEETMRALYQIEAKRLEYTDTSGVRRQILPLRTIGEEKG